MNVMPPASTRAGKEIVRKSGWWGMVGAAFAGSVTLIPGFLAFPMAALLLKSGAGAMQIGAFNRGPKRQGPPNGPPGSCGSRDRNRRIKGIKSDKNCKERNT